MSEMSVGRLQECLRIQFPVIQAGMAGGPTTVELVAEVSRRGGLGTLGAGYMSPPQIREAIQKIRSMTDKPFAVNLLVFDNPLIDSSVLQTAAKALESYRFALGLPGFGGLQPIKDTFTERFQVILEERVPVFSFTFGLLDEKQIAALHERNIQIIGTATTVEEAVTLESLGVDVIVAQGSEAGGHRGTFAGSYESALVGTMSLIPQVVDRVTCPVVAAGGIVDGRQMAAAFALGASGVQMGTAFLTTMEAGTNEIHRQAILASKDTSTVVTNVFSGKPARGIRNAFIDQLTKGSTPIPAYPVQNALTRDIRKEAAKQGRAEWMSLWAGQSSGMAKPCTVAELVSGILEEYQAAISKLPRMF
jgi:nitronate monooxygenase